VLHDYALYKSTFTLLYFTPSIEAHRTWRVHYVSFSHFNHNLLVVSLPR